jgi:transcriptional regulator with XRE-family HTH domain
VYEKFEQLLKERNVTASEVSKATGIKQATLSNWKKRKGNLNIPNTIKIANYFGVSTDWFIRSDS